MNYNELLKLYSRLAEDEKLELWKNFSIYMNDMEIKNCINEVNRDDSNLFEIHWKFGYIEKYQIYFNQILGRKIKEEL